MAKWMMVAVVVAAAALVFAWQRLEPAASATDAAISIVDLLAASADAEFAAVEYPHEFEFPADHLQHQEFRTEWWNVFGVLEDAAGTALGMQMLLVRIGIVPGAPQRPSSWATTDVFAGLASISDPFDHGLLSGQRLSRGAMGIAGTRLEPLGFGIEDWRFAALDGTTHALDLHGRLRIGTLELELRLDNALPLIDTAAIPGSAGAARVPFQFYLQPRLRATGTVRDADAALEVSGYLTFEHAWGELPLPGGPVARDRMTLYFDDGRVVMILVTHRADGSGTPQAAGLLVEVNGQPRTLGADDVVLEVAEQWSGSRTRARYPVRWRLQVPGHGIDAVVDSVETDQEAVEWTAFWAGPVAIVDVHDAALGNGFVQLSGYGAH